MNSLNLSVIDERKVLGKEFKIYGDIENPLFLAKDVAEWIEHNKPSELIRNVDENEKIKIHIDHSDNIAGVLQSNTDYWFLTEDGLYEVLMQSRKPIAKAFKKEVKIILKTIRQNGMYVTDKLLDNPDLAIQAFTKLKEEREKRKALEVKIEEQKPAVIFAGAVSASKNSILIGEQAKLIKQNGVNIGEKRLFTWLRENGYLIKRQGSDYNMPTQRAMELGLFEIKETAVTHSDGHITVNKTPKVTGKGQIYFINKFLE
ncbi:MAG: phage antirepressor [Fusobacterium sp.]